MGEEVSIKSNNSISLDLFATKEWILIIKHQEN